MPVYIVKVTPNSVLSSVFLKKKSIQVFQLFYSCSMTCKQHQIISKEKNLFYKILNYPKYNFSGSQKNIFGTSLSYDKKMETLFLNTKTGSF